MMSNMVVLLTMALVGVVLAAGRPQQHYMDASSQDLADAGMPMLSPEALAHLKLGLWQMLLDAQEYARLRSVHSDDGDDAATAAVAASVDGERPRRIFSTTEFYGALPVKRQGKRLKCYFNPVSCF